MSWTETEADFSEKEESLLAATRRYGDVCEG